MVVGAGAVASGGVENGMRSAAKGVGSVVGTAGSVTDKGISGVGDGVEMGFGALGHGMDKVRPACQYRSALV